MELNKDQIKLLVGIANREIIDSDTKFAQSLHRSIGLGYQYRIGGYTYDRQDQMAAKILLRAEGVDFLSCRKTRT